ncbi:DUF2917 domain-containing protein [Paucibacter sp. B2R-40]|uniref:DUF2917 domain-containing protein n=1 Tax=Paucibacter sp. B2R-40 TaxID=2893554 RepID=UPI0021E3EC95|nr:DUF2917 domain-containing protein [Paucibacter sp. B2R-40]MCV2356114.1 DUF2917 domain-containing protein [Paucibacter sp. B2R-40]
MDSPITRTNITALPGSRRTQLDLPADATRQQLKLHAGQTLLVHVIQGSLWLTRDGHLEDTILQPGAQALLRAPGNYRLGAFGPPQQPAPSLRMRHHRLPTPVQDGSNRPSRQASAKPATPRSSKAST